jgi:hypothetical protein
METTPRFQHDCVRPDCCRYVGQTLTSDVYVYPGPLGQTGLLMRHGSDGPDYITWPTMALARRAAQNRPEVLHAVRLAENLDINT